MFSPLEKFQIFVFIPCGSLAIRRLNCEVNLSKSGIESCSSVKNLYIFKKSQIPFRWNSKEVLRGMVFQGFDPREEGEFLLYVFCGESSIPEEFVTIGNGSIWT